MSVLESQMKNQQDADNTSGWSLLNNAKANAGNPKLAIFGFIFSWVVFYLVRYVVPDFEGLAPEAKTTIAIMCWVIVIWVTDALPKSISGLSIPILLMATGVFATPKESFSGFTGNESFLVIGAFMLAAIMNVTKLDKRIALTIISKVKPRVSNLLTGFFSAHIVTALMVPATLARAGMFLPIVQGVNTLFGDTVEGKRSRKAMAMAAIGFGSVFAAPIFLTGHMPNVIMASLLNSEANAGITWGKWFWLHWPLLGLFPIMYFWVTRFFKIKNVEIPGGLTKIQEEKKDLGKTTGTQWVILGAVVLAVLLWSTEKSLHNFKSGIVMLGVIALLFVPGLTNLKWKEVQNKTNWGTWLLLAGALSLVTAFGSTGADAWLAGQMINIIPAWGWMGILLFVMVLVQVLRLGIISNVGAVTLMAPIIFAMAPLLELNNVAFTLAVLNVDSYALILPMEVTASLIAYSSGEFSFTEFMKVGSVLTLCAILYIAFVMVPWWAFNGFPLWVA